MGLRLLRTNVPSHILSARKREELGSTRVLATRLVSKHIRFSLHLPFLSLHIRSCVTPPQANATLNKKKKKTPKQRFSWWKCDREQVNARMGKRRAVLWFPASLNKYDHRKMGCRFVFGNLWKRYINIERERDFIAFNIYNIHPFLVPFSVDSDNQSGETCLQDGSR